MKKTKFTQVTMDEDCAECTAPAPPQTCNEDKYLEISSDQKAILDLDAIFNLEQSKLHINHRFEKPRCPNKRLPSKYPIHLHEMEILAEEFAQDKTENFKLGEFKPAESGYRYLKIGGMRVLPVPVSGPMFWSEKNK